MAAELTDIRPLHLAAAGPDVIPVSFQGVHNPAFIHDHKLSAHSKGTRGVGDSTAVSREQEVCMDPRGSIDEEEVERLLRRNMKQKKQKWGILKNVIIICVAFLLNFTAFQSLQNLQSSLNREKALGVVSLGVVYGSIMIGCLFLAKPVISLIGCKWAISLSFFTYILYTASNLYPIWETMMPASVLLGLGASILWPAKCTYLTEAGIQYARWTGETEQAVIGRFFGFFFMAFQSAQIWGNLISGFVLQNMADGPNITELSDAELDKCGATYCTEEDKVNNTNLLRPDNIKVKTLCGTYMGLSFLAFLTTALCLGKVPQASLSMELYQHTPGESGNYVLYRPHKKTGRGCGTFAAAFHQLRRLDQVLLIPITMYSGLEQAFIAADFTKSYVSCSLGVWMVGVVLICFGFTNSIFSWVVGKVVKHTGRIPLFIIGCLIHIGLQIWLFGWQLHPSMLWLYFVVVALWGIGDAVWQPMINALYGCVFSDKDKEAAFANYRFWESMGFFAAFIYANYLCVYVKLYILMGMLCLGLAGYFAVEYRQKK